MLKKRSEIMLCYPFDERRLSEPKFGWHFPVVVQPKLDGVRCRAICKGPNVVLLSSTCSIITSVPHINAELEALCLDCELDGELYTHNESFETINSIVSRTVNLHENASSIQFHIFDCINNTNQLERLVNLTHLIVQNNPILHLVSCNIVKSFKEIMEIYEELLSNDYEGIIIRDMSAFYTRKRSRFILKFKPKKNDIYKIIGFKEELSNEGVFKNRLGALICTSDEGTTFSVGSGLDDSFRNSLWKDRENLIGRYVKIAYQNITTASGVPRFPIFCSILDENPEETPDIETGIL